LCLHVLQESRKEILMREDSDNSDVSLELSLASSTNIVLQNIPYIVRRNRDAFTIRSSTSL